MIICESRLDYIDLKEENSDELMDAWDVVIDEYADLLNQNNANNYKRVTKDLMLNHWCNYLFERSMLDKLILKTDVDYIRELRNRGYKIANTSHEDYWDSLYSAGNRVKNNLNQMRLLENRLKDETEQSNEDSKNIFDRSMAWLITNNVSVNENISTKRYIEVSNLVNKKINLLNKHGRNRKKANY